MNRPLLAPPDARSQSDALALDLADRQFEHFIDGAPVAPRLGRHGPATNPSTGLALGRFAIGCADDVDAAAESAQRGQKAWYGMEPAARARILHAIAARIRSESERLTQLEAINCGKPLWLAAADVETCARYFEYFSGVADKLLGTVIPAGSGHLVYATHEPYGVTGHITPWNAALSQAGRGAAPALAAGNSVLVKPALEASITTLELARLCIACGLPPGAFNVVTGDGPGTGGALSANGRIRKLSFTGSVATGRVVAAAAAQGIVPLTLELGGKSPFIVFEDADLEAASALAVRAFALNSGQICSAGTRILVHRSRHDALRDLIAGKLRALRIGHAFSNPDLGPVISQKQRENVEYHCRVAEEEGAQRIAQPLALEPECAGGFFVPPTLFAHATHDMRIAREEVFGPVACMVPFDSDDEALAQANDSDYGLAAAIWTRDIGRAHAFSQQIEAGQVYLNDYQPVGVEAPFGGYKKSGYGREKGLESLKDYSQVRTVIARIR
jgi:acyl-CoA reductase-like NAD-dependent aldehyde dehydrogenase